MTTDTLHDLPRRAVGHTGLQLSPMGFGTVKLGRNQGVKYPTGFELPDDRTALNLLAEAQALGINLLDTAPAYGSSELRLGTLLRGQRQQWLICSKVGEEFTDGESSYCYTPEHIRMSVERSLLRLNTDVIDLMLLHSDGNDVDNIQRYGSLQVLNELKQQGKLRATGISSKTVEGGLLALQHSDCAMVTLNLNQQDEQPVIDYAASHDKGILIKKALASGHICLQPGQDPVQASFELIFARPGVTSVIIGTLNAEHLRHNVAVMASVLQLPKSVID
ncbi:aldo/keto reductase [Pokkaliibacter plantistimulans]|uniref:Aldo/keto reductase n=1 Tax=Pokkaliibacter plantistimulans TaxID=1635171 RepID=A0ABX5M3J4_9GAMM|nr:aldo/keto reductase [Pokkaliibacter plantistimulans]PXF32128.1 aldo/keto reductase [Pokkaliibacter plantistimulans]